MLIIFPLKKIGFFLGFFLYFLCGWNMSISLMSLHFGKPVSSLASNSKETVFFFGQTDYKLYLHTVIFYAKYLWSSFPKSRSTEMKKKKTSVIFNYRFCVNHYSVSFSARGSTALQGGRVVKSQAQLHLFHQWTSDY